MSEASALVAGILVAVPSIIGAGYLLTRKIEHLKCGCCECDQLASKQTSPRDQEMLSALQGMSEAVQTQIQQTEMQR